MGVICIGKLLMITKLSPSTTTKKLLGLIIGNIQLGKPYEIAY